MRGLLFSAGYWVTQALFTLTVVTSTGLLTHVSLLGIASPLIDRHTLTSVALAGFVFWAVGLIFRQSVTWLKAFVLGGLCYIVFSVIWLSMEFFVPHGLFSDCSRCALFIVVIVISLSTYGIQANRRFNRDAQKAARPLS